MKRTHRARRTPTVEPLETRQMLSATSPTTVPRHLPPAEIAFSHFHLPARSQASPASEGARVVHLGKHPGPALAQAGFNVAQVRHAYGVDKLGLDGQGQVIAVVTAMDAPFILKDLRAFDRANGLPDPPFLKIVPRTGTPAFDAGWAEEATLDVEWSHAIAPRATILLVEAASSSYDDLLTAVDTAVARGATVVSMSWGGEETPFATAYDAHFNRPGVTFVAASGDVGGEVNYPSVSPYVTAVGGTRLTTDPAGNRLGESAWTNGGGGVSRFERRPSYQAGFHTGLGRGVPDVAFDADPRTGFMVYSTAGGGWEQIGGTSAGTPQWAGLFALANQGRALLGKGPLGKGLPFGVNSSLYALAGRTGYTNPLAAFLDVTAGSNGFSARPGFDYATGLGVPIASRLVPALMAL
ncbi:MAG: S53 family peptidase [Isosphaeraceae bacterium]